MLDERDFYKGLDSRVHRQMQKWLERQDPGCPTRYGRRLTSDDAISAGIWDHWRAGHEIAKWLSSHAPGRTLSFCMTDSAAVNAWAFYQGPANNESTIVITSSFALRIQRMAKLVLVTALIQKRHPPELGALLDLMKSEDIDPYEAAAFTQLIATATFQFALFHEGAHILRGHGIQAAAQEPAGEQICEVDAGASAAAAQATPVNLKHPNVIARTKEFDADIHAFYWLDLYLEHHDPGRLDALGAASERVFSRLLTDPRSRRFVVLLSSFCFHLAVGDKASAISPLNGSTHPSRQERVQLSYLTDATLAFHRGVEPRMFSGPVHFASVMIVADCAFALGLFPDALAALGRCKDAPLADQLTAASTWIGISLDDAKMDQLYERRLQLAGVMQEVASRLDRSQRLCKLPVLRWWDGEVGD